MTVCKLVVTKSAFPCRESVAFTKMEVQSQYVIFINTLGSMALYCIQHEGRKTHESIIFLLSGKKNEKNEIIQYIINNDTTEHQLIG
jgi:hypothetical protein